MDDLYTFPANACEPLAFASLLTSLLSINSYLDGKQNIAHIFLFVNKIIANYQNNFVDKQEALC